MQVDLIMLTIVTDTILNISNILLKWSYFLNNLTDNFINSYIMTDSDIKNIISNINIIFSSLLYLSKILYMTYVYRTYICDSFIFYY